MRPAAAMDERALARERVAIDLSAELLRRGQPVEIVVGGASMWPLVRAGDRLRLEPAVGARPGALGAVLRDGRLVVHRVLAVRGSTLVFKGDNNHAADPDVGREHLLAIVTRQHTRGGRVIDHRNPLRRLVNRLAARLSRTSQLPWRLAHALQRARASWRGLRRAAT